MSIRNEIGQTMKRFRVSYNAPQGAMLKQKEMIALSYSDAGHQLREKFNAECKGSGEKVRIISVVEIVGTV